MNPKYSINILNQNICDRIQNNDIKDYTNVLKISSFEFVLIYQGVHDIKIKIYYLNEYKLKIYK
jgi:hypothetical protein